jgi:hypothetical protein
MRGRDHIYANWWIKRLHTMTGNTSAIIATATIITIHALPSTSVATATMTEEAKLREGEPTIVAITTIEPFNHRGDPTTC